MNTNFLTSTLPKIDLEKIKRNEKEILFSHLPILKSQQKFGKKDMNRILNETKLIKSMEMFKNIKK